MPKIRTHRGTAKRVKVTATGKVLHRHQFSGCGHILSKKSRKRKRKFRKDQPTFKGDLKRLRADHSLLGLGGELKAMARIKRGVNGLKHRRKVMKLVKGFRAARRRNYRVANEALLKSLAYAFRDRRVRKRDFRSLWISRINAAVRREGLSYSVFMHGLKKSGVMLNRKALADLAVSNQKAFGALLELAKKAVQI